jgi:hypothetical protein
MLSSRKADTVEVKAAKEAKIQVSQVWPEKI